MRDEFRDLRKRQTPQSEPERDTGLGYISVQELTNVFVERMRSLDVEIWPKEGRTPGRDEMLEFFSTMKIELFMRAGKNYRDFCRKNPETKTQMPAKEQADDASYKANFEARQARLAKYR